MYKLNSIRWRTPKRVFCVILSIFMAASVAACGGNTQSKGANSTGNNNLTISVVTKDRYLDAAITKYRELHPEVTIDVKEYTSNPLPTGKNQVMIKKGDSPEDIEKYVSAINTQLMSGKGTDIVLLNNLPYEKYADKNLIADLSSMMQLDKNFNINNYYANILDAMKYNGKLYGMPLSVNLSIMTANKAALEKSKADINDDKWNWDDFIKVAEKVVDDGKKEGIQDMYALVGMDEKMLISSLVRNNYNKFVDKSKKSAAFDSKEFVDLLNLSKYMIDNKLVNTNTSQGEMADRASRGKTVFSNSNIGSFLELALTKINFSEGAEYLKYPGEENLPFTADAMYGINNNSPNKAVAWDFIKFLTSDEMMIETGLTGFPINKNVIDKVAENTTAMTKKAGIRIAINGQMLSSLPISQDDIEFIKGLLGEASKYAGTDRKIISIVQEESQTFFTGQKSSEETAKAIQNRVNTYINE